MTKKRYFVSFIGGIGAGKTTGAELIAKKLGFLLVRERFPNNNFLPLFYKDMKRWALHSQLFFFIEKINQLLSIKKELTKRSVVQDLSIYQDFFVFKKAHKILGNIAAQDYRFFQKIYKRAEPVLPRSDLLIYLKWSPEKLVSQIKKRNRSYEKNISLNYLKLLHKLSEEWVRKNSEKFNILAVDTEKLNFANNGSHKGEFISLVKSRLKQKSR